MNKRLSPAAPARSIIETLESRTLLCGTASTGSTSPNVSTAAVIERSASVTSAKPIKKAATKTTLVVSAGTLAAPVTFTATVRAPVAAGSPVGSINIIDHGNILQTVGVSPTTSINAKFAYSNATYTLVQQPGGSFYYFGRHPVKATFVPTGTFKPSSAAKAFVVTKPVYNFLSDSVGTDTVTAGSGPQIQAGQTANMFYTGYLVAGGHIFDDSVNDGGTPFQFVVGAGRTITGFDEGASGMQAGETRIVFIPAAEGYGTFGSPPAIPANADLIFVLTLVSFS